MNSLAFIQNISMTDIILVLCVILLFVGAKRLPDLIRSLGKSCREFKGAARSDASDHESKEDAQ